MYKYSFTLTKSFSTQRVKRIWTLMSTEKVKILSVLSISLQIIEDTWNLQTARKIDGFSVFKSEVPPFKTISHWMGSIKIPYLNEEFQFYLNILFIDETKNLYLSKFSRESLRPPIKSNKNPQLTNPVKSRNSDDQENKESLGLWHLVKKKYI